MLYYNGHITNEHIHLASWFWPVKYKELYNVCCMCLCGSVMMVGLNLENLNYIYLTNIIAK